MLIHRVSYTDTHTHVQFYEKEMLSTEYTYNISCILSYFYLLFSQFICYCCCFVYTLFLSFLLFFIIIFSFYNSSSLGFFWIKYFYSHESNFLEMVIHINIHIIFISFFYSWFFFSRNSSSFIRKHTHTNASHFVFSFSSFLVWDSGTFSSMYVLLCPTHLYTVWSMVFDTFTIHTHTSNCRLHLSLHAC